MNKLPIRLVVIFSLWSILLFVIVFSHFQDPISNPFTAYSSLYPGKFLNPSDLVRLCDKYSIYEYYPPYSQYASCTLKDSPIRSIYMTLSDDMEIVYTTFYLSDKKVRIGDVLYWYPDIKFHVGKYTFRWSNPTLAFFMSRRNFNYFHYVRYIVFRTEHLS